MNSIVKIVNAETIKNSEIGHLAGKIDAKRGKENVVHIGKFVLIALITER
jgi:hypothetical protein